MKPPSKTKIHSGMIYLADQKINVRIERGPENRPRRVVCCRLNGEPGRALLVVRESQREKRETKEDPLVSNVFPRIRERGETSGEDE